MNLKEKLISSGLFIDNDYLDLYLAIIDNNYYTIKSELTQKHHIFPRSYSKYLNLEIDNSKENLINLDFKDHCLAHYYLAMCACNEKLALKNKYALYRMLGDKLNPEEILNISREDFNLIYFEILEHNKKLHLGTHHTTSNETKEKIGQSNFGNNSGTIYIFKDDEELRIYPDELCNYLALGYVRGRSDKAKQNLSKNYNYNSKGMLGKKQSEKQKNAVSQALTGITRQESTKAKQSESRKNTKYVMLVIPNTNRVIQVKEENLQKYLDKGYCKKD